MKNKVTIASSHVDRHGDTMRDVLQKTMEAMNGSTKSRMLVNHKRNLPPIGYWDNAEIVSEGKHHYLKADEKFYRNRQVPEWDNSLFIETNELNTQLISRNTPTSILTLSVDKNNFRAFEEYEKVFQVLKDYVGGRIENRGSCAKSCSA